jgi:hypothetical protein
MIKKRRKNTKRIAKLKDMAHRLLNVEGTLENKLEKVRAKRRGYQDAFRKLESEFGD